MAIGDTANLIVQLRLDDKISGPLNTINTRLGRVNVNTGLIGKGMGQIGTGVGVAFTRSLLLGGVAAAGLTTQVVKGVDSLRELEKVQAATVAGLKSTRAVSGQTAEGIRALSEEYETLGGVIDDKVIQSGANVLLTFRRIGPEAFEPALEQALNLSTALGSDLQTAILQVGKALDDPVRGVTALRRAGVILDEQQQEQIKTLIEQNNLYGAQQIILRELERQVGGRFAAAGRTQEATIGRLKDAIEELQKSLARAFIPVLDNVARKLTTLFSDPTVIRRVEEFGNRLASFFTEDRFDAAIAGVKGVFGYLAAIPWGTIGEGLKIAGQGAKVVIDAFLALPKEVQGVVVTALAAHKLSGGLITSGIGNIAKGLFGGLRGQTPVSPMYVHVVNQGIGTPGGGAPAGGRAPWLTTLLGAGSLTGLVTTVAGIATPFLMFNVIPELFKGAPGTGEFTARRRDEQGRTIVELGPQSVAMMQGLMPGFTAAVERAGNEVSSTIEQETRPVNSGITSLREETRHLLNPLLGIREINQRSALGIERVRSEVREMQVRTQAGLRDVARRESETAQRIREARQAIHEQRLSLSSRLDNSNSKLERIANKDTSLNLDLTIPVASYVSVNEVIRQSVVVGTIRNNIPVGPGI